MICDSAGTSPKCTSPKHTENTVDLALLHHLTTRYDRHVLEDLSTPASADPVVTAAYRLLVQLEPDECPPLDRVHVGPAPGEGACYQGLIVVNPRGAFYEAAQHGDCLQLAMLIHHECWHSRNGGDELSALAASAAFVERHRSR
jgi:hypothetical protein